MGQKVRFAHLADLHLGAFRERRLTDLNFRTFKKAIDRACDLKVDFAIFAGDIFNNAMPPIELVQKVTGELMRLKEKDIPLYVIGGSHDYSNSGKSFLSLLDLTGVFVDVCKFEYLDLDKVKLKFTEDERSSTVLSGILGKKNGLDKNIYANLDPSSLKKDRFNVFLFHTTLNDFKPDFMRAVKTDVTKSYLPEGFDYYAGGHIHTHMEGEYSTGILSYPGPLFPNSFSELKRERPSFNLCEFDFETRDTKIRREFLDTYEKEYVKIEICDKNPIEARGVIEDKISNLDVNGKIVLLEVSGVVCGRVSDIGLNKVSSGLYDRGAFVVLKNTYKLTSSSLELSEQVLFEDSDSIESEIILKCLNEVGLEGKEGLVKSLLALDLGKIDGEKVSQYEDRVLEAVEKSLNT